VIRVLDYGAALCVLTLLAWVPGFAIVRLGPGLRQLSGLTRLAELCLGLVFWTLAVFGLAALGALHGTGLAALATVATLLALWVRWKGPSLPPTSQPAPPGASSPLWFVLLIGALLVASLLVGMGPDVSWDASVYHLTVPKLYVANRGFRPIPFNVYSNWPLGTEMLFAAAMLARDYVLAKLVHFGFGVLTLYALLVGCREFDRPAAGWLAMAFFLANPWVAHELGIAYVDLAQGFFLLAGVLFALRAREEGPGATPALLLSGICCGAVAGTKVTGVVSAGVIAALHLPRLVAARRGGRLGGELRRSLVAFVLPAALVCAPWLAKAAWFTGNPVYPFLQERFGAPDWSAALAEQFGEWQRSTGAGRTALDTLLLPFRVLLRTDPGDTGFHGSIGPLWIVLLPLSLVLGARRRMARYALAAAGLQFLGWAFSSQQVRLLLPALPLLALAAAASVQELVERLDAKPRILARRAVLGITALTLLWVHSWNLESGLRHLRLFHERGADLAPEIPEAYRIIDAELPSDARILFVNVNRGFFCSREYLADSFFQASQIADWLRPARSVDALRGRLDARGITHLLVEDRDWGIDYPEALAELLEDPLHARRLHQDDDRRFTLYGLLPGGDRARSVD
jgi:hypothetical protein